MMIDEVIKMQGNILLLSIGNIRQTLNFLRLEKLETSHEKKTNPI
jgi:ribosomal protein L30/L7E